jgi:RHS repeat-associated protein
VSEIYDYIYDANSTAMTVSVTRAIGEVLRIGSVYRGEQYDPDLGLYYLRARYYNPQTGRFLNRDPADGAPNDPKTLHKYLYAGGDPINALDPTGRTLAEYTQQIKLTITRVTVAAVAFLQEEPIVAAGYAVGFGCGVWGLAVNWDSTLRTH